MKKVLNKGVYLRTVNQLIYLAILMLFIGIIIVIADFKFLAHDFLEYAVKSLTYNLAGRAQFVVMVIGSCCLSFSAIKFIWSKSRTDFEYSIPTTRGVVFASKAIGVITVQTLILLFITIISLLFSSRFFGVYTFIGDIFVSFVYSIIGSLVIIGAIFFASSVTGHPLSTSILSLGIITIPLYYTLIRIQLITEVLSYEYTFVPFRMPLYILQTFFFPIITNYAHTGHIASIIISTALAICYFVMGYFMFGKRSGELAGTHTKNRLIHFITMSIIPYAIINYAVIEFGKYSLHPEFFYKSKVNVLIFLITVPLVLIFIYDIFVNKKLMKNNRCIWVYFFLIILALFCNCAIEQALLLEGNQKIKLEQVESISVVTDGNIYDFQYPDSSVSYGEYLTSDYKISDRDIIDEMLYHYGKNTEYNYTNVLRYDMIIRFNFISGRSLYKYVNFTREGEGEVTDKNITMEILDDNEFTDNYHTPLPIEYVTHVSYGGIFLSEESSNKFKEIYKIFTEEYETLTVEQKEVVRAKSFWLPSYFWLDIDDEKSQSHGTLYVKGRVGGTNIIDIYELTEYTPKALKAYQDIIYEVSTFEFDKKK